MNWIEVTLRTTAALTDDIAEVLSEYGYQGVVVERGDIPDNDPWDEATIPPPTHHIVRAYFPDDDQAAALQAQIRAAVASFPVEPPVFRKLAEEDWAEAWKANYHALRVGERLLIRPAWEHVPPRPADVEIVLDPGMAFGTGTHATTQLCLQAVDEIMPPGARVLDLGCGSAILSIAAAKLGARSVYAIDIDPVAIEAAQGNIAHNDVTEAVTLATGSLPDVLALGAPFDFALVNILARVILQMCDEGLEHVVRPGGTAVFSGLITSQVAEVEAALARIGFTPTNRRTIDDWALIEAVRST